MYKTKNPTNMLIQDFILWLIQIYKIKFIPISNIIMFSIIVASVIGRLSTEPRQAHLMLFFDKIDFITPNVVADKITMVI